MYKFLCKAESFNEKQEMIKRFEENSIRYKAKVSGPNIFQRAGYEKKCYWFRIYVDKADYPIALEIIGNN